jgi:hypothetical protein
LCAVCLCDVWLDEVLKKETKETTERDSQ